MNFKLWLENLMQSVPPQFIDSDGLVDLYRYSRSPRGASYLIDPAKTTNSRNMYSLRDYKTLSVPRTFFYLDIDEKESMIGNNLYHARFPAKDIYNITNDPLGYVAKTQAQNFGALNFDMLISNLMNDGYKGIYYKTNFHVINLFVPVVGQATTEEFVRSQKKMAA